MNRMKKPQAGIPGRIVLAGLISVSILLICSKNSPLYPMNDWVDVNCFFTVGRGMRHGLTPYLDLYEQKGPLLYAAYALAAWISETSYPGVFLVETVCFAAFLFFSGRIAETLSDTPAAFGPAAAYSWSGNVYLLGTDREEMPQYRFAETIRQSEDTSLLNYGFLDGGFYFAAETLPVTRFFCTLNNDLEEMQRELRAAVSEGKAEFIVTRQQKLKDTGRYQLIDEAEMIFEGRVWTYYLYQRKTR